MKRGWKAGVNGMNGETTSLLAGSSAVGDKRRIEESSKKSIGDVGGGEKHQRKGRKA